MPFLCFGEDCERKQATPELLFLGVKISLNESAAQQSLPTPPFFQSPEGNFLCLLRKALGTFQVQEEASIDWWLELKSGHLEIRAPLTSGTATLSCCYG